MKIGTMVYFNEAVGIEDKFASVKKLGISSCQLCSWNTKLWTDENAQLIKELSGKYEVEIAAVWCGWSGPAVWDFYDGQITLGLVPPDYRQVRIKELCSGADFAKGIGVTDVVTYSGKSQ